MARTPMITDQWGNPVSTKALTREFAAPTFASVRSVWSQSVLSGLDPIGMAEVLHQAGQGYPDRFFTLAEEMEERDMHYRSVLATRKLAITGIEPIVVAASESAEDEKIAEAVRDLVAQPEFIDDYLTDLLDGLSKGYSIVETIWDRSGKTYWPRKYKWRDPRHFQIDRIDGRTLRMKEPGHADGIDLPPFQFSVHRPKLKSGLPIRGGLARLAAWAFLFKSYTIKDWMAFLEVYGMPLRVGKFGRGASHNDKRVLLQAVRDISTDAAAIIPKEMEIEFVEVTGGTGNGLFSAKAEYLDKQVSKGVLGQTMSTDDGASLSQAQVHENVRHDIARADARQTAVTANRDLIRPYVDLNFGPRDIYPTVVIPIVENEDIKALVEAVEKLVPLGLEVSMSGVRERIGFEDPDEGEKLLRPAAMPVPKLSDKKTPPPEDEGATARACPHCGSHHALARAADERDELDLLVEEALSQWEADLEPLIKPFEILFEKASNYDEILAGLDALAGEMDAGPLAKRLATAMMTARGIGDTGKDR